MASEAWLRRFALQIGAMLPENQKDARRVLDYTRELVDTFMRPHSGLEKPQGEVFSLNRASASESPSSSSTGIPRVSPSQSHIGVKPGTD